MDVMHIVQDERFYKWVIVVLSSLLLYFVLSAVHRTIIRIGGERAARTPSLLDDLFIDILRNMKRYFILGLSVYIVLVFTQIPPRPRMIINKTFILLALLQFAQVAGLIINFWITKHLRVKTSQDMAMASTVGLISVALKFIVFTLILLMALNNVGVDITALVAGLGVGGIAVALAMQNILSDLFSSLTIVLDKPFIVGDFIAVNELMGTVEHIGLKTTRLKSLSGEQLIFGNADLLQSRIKNFKRMEERRIVQSLTVTYQTSPDLLDKIPEIIKNIIEKQPSVRFDRCHFLRFKDSALEFELVYWVLNREFNIYADIAQAINVDIFRTFAKEKIDFAYPTQTLFIHKSE